MLTKLEFSRHIFEQYSNIKFDENPSSRSRVVPCGRTERHNVNSRFSQLYERVKNVRNDEHSAARYTKYNRFTTVVTGSANSERHDLLLTGLD